MEIIDDYNVNLTISEGRYHQVKRMFAALGNKVEALHRWRIGDVVLDESLEEGEYRPLTEQEIGASDGNPKTASVLFYYFRNDGNAATACDRYVFAFIP
ncbi:ribosomal small subunit pseudouridine synthase A [Actinobacillus equuli]|nr:ribosomal small subunit pseudouridine synthase A [Actinobacillus equuli]